MTDAQQAAAPLATGRPDAVQGSVPSSLGISPQPSATGAVRSASSAPHNRWSPPSAAAMQSTAGCWRELGVAQALPNLNSAVGVGGKRAPLPEPVDRANFKRLMPAPSTCAAALDANVGESECPRHAASTAACVLQAGVTVTPCTLAQEGAMHSAVTGSAVMTASFTPADGPGAAADNVYMVETPDELPVDQTVAPHVNSPTLAACCGDAAVATFGTGQDGAKWTPGGQTKQAAVDFDQQAVHVQASAADNALCEGGARRSEQQVPVSAAELA
jgi:hypothetical protein